MSHHDPKETDAGFSLRLALDEMDGAIALCKAFPGDYSTVLTGGLQRAYQHVKDATATLHASKGGDYDVAADAVREGRVGDARRILNQMGYAMVVIDEKEFRTDLRRLAVAIWNAPSEYPMSRLFDLIDHAIGNIAADEICKMTT